ncbi:MAG: molybdopterin-dependent oxidoreductase [Chloroflexi bacterium]|nr:molybdopterin-dependent oxidoreductase [Chloroflexota bacterium]
MQIKFILNGAPVMIDIDPVKPLLDTIREDLHLTGTKQGCDHEGECGACTVLLNGNPVRSCLTPTGKIQGQHILTIEGLGSQEHPHPLQTAFMKTGAIQCGYCIPGMLLTSKALLDREPDPSREQIKKDISGNLCRCTGYQRIIGAVELAASQMKDPAKSIQVDLSAKHPVIGGQAIRADAWEKVSGETQYTEDLHIPGALQVIVLRSPHHHARLLSLQIADAKSIDGVVKIITASDIPGENGLGDYSRDEPVLVPVGDTCKMLGAPIALIVGETTSAARAGRDAIKVEFEELPYSFTLEESQREGMLPIYRNGNLLTTASVSWGDLEDAFAKSDHVLETVYRTSWQEHAALERETLVGYFDERDRLTVIGGTHEPHWQQGYIASCLALPLDTVRVIMPPTGGSFGGRQDPWPFLATALASFFSRQPVRLSYSRLESFIASPKRHPYRVNIKLGAGKNGSLTGIQVRIQANTGGYDGHGQYIVDYALTGSAGPYTYQAVDGVAESIYSNGPKAGQFRGFGTPQSTFALECTLDEMAQTLDYDPLEFRKINRIYQSSRTFLGYPIQESLGYPEVLESIKSPYKAYLEEAAEFNSSQSSDSPYRRGVGFAGMWYRFGKSGALTVKVGAELSPEGELIISCSAPDYGQGSSTVMSQMAAETLGIPREGVKILNADTALTPDSGIQGASRATYFVGGSVVRAAKILKQALLSSSSELLDCDPQSLQLTTEGITCIQPSKTGTIRVSYLDLYEELSRLNHPTSFTGIFDLEEKFPESSRPKYIPLFVTGAQVADVLVNLHTGEVQIPRITAAHDAGRVINPLDARGQIEGAIMMGIGTALMEEYLPGITQGFGDYYLPTALSTPEINSILVEVPSLEGPFGVKGLGEAAILPTAPAIINGISRVIGSRIRSLPATPERVLNAIHQVSQQGKHD